jgi:DNA helicase-2/ATP-dependent DNA helicase PcrA
VADADDIPSGAPGADGGVVTLMTLHTAKGLEFPVVFLSGMEDGTFPHMRALSEPLELEEERRLAYVGITRARERLFLSRATVRTSWGQPAYNPPSRFLDELPGDAVHWTGVDPKPSAAYGSAQRRVAATGLLTTWIGEVAVRGTLHELTGFFAFVAMCAVTFLLLFLTRGYSARSAHA